MKKTSENITEVLKENRFKLEYDLNYLSTPPNNLYKINMPNAA